MALLPFGGREMINTVLYLWVGFLFNMSRESGKINNIFAEIMKNKFRYCILRKSGLCYKKMKRWFRLIDVFHIGKKERGGSTVTGLLWNPFFADVGEWLRCG